MTTEISCRPDFITKQVGTVSVPFGVPTSPFKTNANEKGCGSSCNKDNDGKTSTSTASSDLHTAISCALTQCLPCWRQTFSTKSKLSYDIILVQECITNQYWWINNELLFNAKLI